MAPEARSKFGAPKFEPEVFRKQMYCIEKSRPTCVIVGAYWGPPQSFGTPHSDLTRPYWFGARGVVPPCPLVTTLGTKTDIGPLAWVLVEICEACLYSNQNIETATMLRFSNIATSAAVLFWAWWQKNSMSTYIHPDPSTSRARVRCTSCTRRS